MIHINNLSRKAAKHREFLIGAAVNVIDSGRFILGHYVEAFEQEFAAYLGVEHCVSLANGTDALELALRAVGIKPGEKVATAANAGMYATTAVSLVGGVPFFMDVAVDSRCATLAEVKRCVKEGARAVVVTHLYGLLCPEIYEIAVFCEARAIPLIEDCAQAHGASFGAQKAGSFGTAATYSFYPTKNLGGLGDGGAVTTNSADIASSVRLLRQYGWTEKYCVGLAGARNSRLDEMQAAMLSVLLPGLDRENDRRRQIAAFYNATIHNPAVITPDHAGESYVAHLYVVRSPERNALRAHMHQRGIGSDVHYPIPDYRQEIVRGKHGCLWLENTEKLCAEILTLPCYPELQVSEAKAVVDAVNSFGV